MKAKQNGEETDLKDLTPKQTEALPLLAAGKTGVQVAEAVDVNPATVSQWLNHDPNFVEALDRLRWESLRTAQAELESTATEAVTELRKLVTDAKSEQVRLRAAEFVLTAIGLNQGKDFFRELKAPKPAKIGNGGPLDIDKVLEGLGVRLQ